jgi:hypothetical protein
MTEKIKSPKTKDKTIIVPGRDKPKDIPGRQWFPVRNDSLKPQQTRAWRLGPKPDPDAEFSWPPEIPPEKRVSQGHFMDIVDKAKKDEG